MSSPAWRAASPGCSASSQARCSVASGIEAALADVPDICPDSHPDNLDRLASALRALKARVRTEGVDGGLPFSCDAAFLSRFTLLNLEAEAGDVDLAFQPAGTQGYDDLARHVARFDLDGIVAPTASLVDIIRSKAAANRPKDQAALPVLGELARKLGSTT